MKKLSIIGLLLISLLFTGCDQTSSTLGGAAIGTGMGAVVGNAIGGDTGATALGAVLGGLAGAAIGSNEGAKRNPQPRQPVVVEKQVPAKVVSRPTRVIHHETRIETVRPVHVVRTPVVRETVIVKEEPRIIAQPAVVVHHHTTQPRPQQVTHTHTTINKTVHNNTFCDDDEDDYDDDEDDDEDYDDDEDDDY